MDFSGEKAEETILQVVVQEKEMRNKFRTWDDEVNHMYYPPNEHIFLGCDGYCMNFQTGKKLIPLFWTGLLDKNGKEIWEGDEVVWHTWDGYMGVSTVEFRDGQFYPIAKGCLDYQRFDEDKGFEVIGNIWENKNVLEDKCLKE